MQRRKIILKFDMLGKHVNKFDIKIHGIQQISKNSNYFSGEVKKIENVKKMQIKANKGILSDFFILLFCSLSKFLLEILWQMSEKKWSDEMCDTFESLTFSAAIEMRLYFISLNKSPKSRPHFKAIQLLEIPLNAKFK